MNFSFAGPATLGFLVAAVLVPPGHAAAAPVGTPHNPPPAKPTIVLQRVAIPETDRQMGMGVSSPVKQTLQK